MSTFPWNTMLSVGAGVACWLIMRGYVTRSEVSEMIRNEAPDSMKEEYGALRNEVVKLREEVSRLVGVLETLMKGRG